jgi:hypothetical protein
MAALALIKTQFASVLDVLLLRGDVIAEKVLIAWRRYPREAFQDSPLRKDETPLAALDRLWEEVGPINFQKLSVIAGLPRTRVEKSFEHLRAAMIVWPDGTIAGDAMNLLIGSGNAHIRGLLPKTQAAAPKEKDDERKRTDAKDAEANRKPRVVPGAVQATRQPGRRRH